MVVLWTNEGLPLGVVSLLPIILFPSFDILSTNATAVNYSQSIIFLFLGGFLVAIAVEKTSLHKIIAYKMLKIFPSTTRGMIFSLIITSGLMSSFLSNTTTTLLLIPLSLFLTEDTQIKVRFALAIAYGASIGGIMTPIGTPPNLILMGILESNQIATISFIKWIALVAPLSIIMFIFVGFVLSYGLKEKKIILTKQIEKTTFEQKKVIFLLISLIILLLLNSPIKPFYEGFGLNEKGVLLAFGLLLFAPPFNILECEDIKKVPFEIIFLFGAGFSIATAFSHTGLDSSIAQYLKTLTFLPQMLLLLTVATIITFTTEITSNTALISMMLPVIYSLTSSVSTLDSMLFLMVATICSSYAFMLPIATPPNAIAMSYKVVKIETMVRFGFLFNIVGIILIVLIAKFFWSYFI